MTSTPRRRCCIRMSLIFLCFPVVVSLGASETHARHPAGNILKPTQDGQAWVEQTLKQLSIEEKVGQMLQIRIYGDYPYLYDPGYRFVRGEIQKYHIGSVDLGAHMYGPNLVKGTPLEIASITNQLQRESKIPLLVGADIERGLASRLVGVADFPFPMAFGAIGDPEVVERFASITAQQARAVGIQWAFAPDADVNSNPDNPIINTRSFGENPERVDDLVAAYVRGAHQNGMLVAAKHFPGQGDTTSDPHVRVTRIDGNREHLDHYELPPFRAAIKAGTDSVMLAQVLVPALDPTPERLATTSPVIVDGILRKQLKFKGVVITDALEMQGLMGLYRQDANPSGRVAVDAIKAGDDVLMLPGNLDAAFNAIVAAVKSGEIPESRIDESVRRILQMKAALGLDHAKLVDRDQVQATLQRTDADQFAQQVSDAAITLVRDNGYVLPLSKMTNGISGNSPQPNSDVQHHRLVVVIFTDSNRSRLGNVFEKEIKVRYPEAKIFHYYNDHIGSDANLSAVIPMVNGADAVVVAAFVTHMPKRQIMFHEMAVTPVGFSEVSAQFLESIVNTAQKKTVVIAFGSPYLITTDPKIQNYICTYSLAAPAEISAVKALFGGIQNDAHLPVTIPGVAKMGFSLPWPKH